jgi:hypothetical protein
MYVLIGESDPTGLTRAKGVEVVTLAPNEDGLLTTRDPDRCSQNEVT